MEFIISLQSILPNKCHEIVDLVCFSGCSDKLLTKTNLGGRSLFHGAGYSVPLKEVRARTQGKRTQGKNLEAGPEAHSMEEWCILAFLPCPLSGLTETVSTP